jgi:superfamily II DNA or RNA helicase
VEILQRVRVRRAWWRVADVHAYESCRLLTLTDGVRMRRVLAPFDDVEPDSRPSHPRPAGLRRWRRACRAAIASDTPPGCLRAALRARMDLLPHQLAPALAVVRGLGTRFLLADDVGLGKTVQAGLVIAELIARRAADRVLVVTPAGLREQWMEELRARFGLDASIADARALRLAVASLPVGVNPWTPLAIAITSLDYLKRPEVLPAAAAIRWDILVVDEAHGAAGDSDRRAAVERLAARSAYVLLVTATPHSGDTLAFDALRRIGAVDGEPLVTFRRTRTAVRGAGLRRVRTIPIAPTATERLMYAALARYQQAVRAEHGDRALALSVLEKRACSSAWSLAESVERRIAALGGAGGVHQQQLLLPLDDADGETTGDDAPPMWPSDLSLADVDRERRLLESVSAAARQCAGNESKVRALLRLLRRVREPVLIFTEYRDTAMHLHRLMPRPAALLHGAMDRAGRASAIAGLSRPGAILIATDAAGQGLNLHRGCRFVVNVELPWNPMRLEQRIGRVDRIGQPRTVHALHLVAKGTGEERVHARLLERIAKARETFDVADPVGGAPQRPLAGLTPSTAMPDVAGDADGEAARLAQARRFVTTRDEGSAAAADDGRPLLVHLRRRRIRTALAGRTLRLYRLAAIDGVGHVAESRVIGVSCAARGVSDPLALVPSDSLDRFTADARAAAAQLWTVRLARERVIAEAESAGAGMLYQATLFNRSLGAAVDETEGSDRGDAAKGSELRVLELQRRALVAATRVELLLVAHP